MKKSVQLEQLRKTQNELNNLFLMTNNHEISRIYYKISNELNRIEEIIKEAK